MQCTTASPLSRASLQNFVQLALHLSVRSIMRYHYPKVLYRSLLTGGGTGLSLCLARHAPAQPHFHTLSSPEVSPVKKNPLGPKVMARTLTSLGKYISPRGWRVGCRSRHCTLLSQEARSSIGLLLASAQPDMVRNGTISRPEELCCLKGLELLRSGHVIFSSSCPAAEAPHTLSSPSSPQESRWFSQYTSCMTCSVCAGKLCRA
mmetsp:Transcript_38220/g.83135  ORF Transcript_38220/g.83135 Transcript_38220/m.83135 type:complete len:205 (+) Transcript_38220:126-740(+)